MLPDELEKSRAQGISGQLWTSLVRIAFTGSELQLPKEGALRKMFSGEMTNYIFERHRFRKFRCV